MPRYWKPSGGAGDMNESDPPAPVPDHAQENGLGSSSSRFFALQPIWSRHRSLSNSSETSTPATLAALAGRGSEVRRAAAEDSSAGFPANMSKILLLRRISLFVYVWGRERVGDNRLRYI